MNATQESGPALDQGIAFQLGKCVMGLQTALLEKMKLTSLRADIAVCIGIKSMHRIAETSALMSFYIHLLSPKQHRNFGSSQFLLAVFSLDGLKEAYMLRTDRSFCKSVHEVSQIRILTHSPYPKMCSRRQGKVCYMPFLLNYLCFPLFISKKECCVLIRAQD